jgi:hypothetical protein
LGARSIILTSGTLSPLAAFQEEIGIPLPVQLENKHIISASQVRHPQRGNNSYLWTYDLDGSRT